MSHQEDVVRAFFAALTPDMEQDAEQIFEHCKAIFHDLANSIRNDLLVREETVGIADDSAQFVVALNVLTDLVLAGGPPALLGAMQMLTAALFEAARAPRVDPLEHLDYPTPPVGEEEK